MSYSRQQLLIICPVYNEEVNIEYFFSRLLPTLEKLDSTRYAYRLLFTNNRSSDRTLEKIQALQDQYPWVGYLTLSRNHGYQLSLLSGLTTVEADLYMVCDVDCEDPPEMLHPLLEQIEQGHDYAYGIRNNRPDPWLLGKMRRAFYFTLRSLGDYNIVPFMSEFAVFRKTVRDSLIRGNNSFPFLRAEVGYAGFSIKGVSYRREARRNGVSHYNWAGNFRFAIAGILSSTTFPLRMMFYALAPLCEDLFIVGDAALLGDVGLPIVPDRRPGLGPTLDFAIGRIAFGQDVHVETPGQGAEQGLEANRVEAGHGAL